MPESRPTRVNRDTLLKLLNVVRPGLSPSDLIAQSACFVFQGGWVVTFNGEVSCRIRTPFPEDVEGAVHADELVRVLENMRDDEVLVELTDREFKVRADHSRKKSGIRREAEILLPVEEIERPQGWSPLPGEEFSKALKKVQETAGTNVKEFLTVCIHIHPDWLEACNRYQATRYRLKTGVSRPFLVRKSSLSPLVETPMDKISETDKWVHFKARSGLVYSCRRHLETYPDLGPMFDFRGEPVHFPTGADDAGKLASIFASDEKDKTVVTVEMRDGEMVVRGEGAYGWAEQPLDMPSYKGEPTSFQITPELLTQIVAAEKECEIGPKKLLIDGKEWTYVTVLGKPKAGAGKPRPRPKDEPAPEPQAEDDKERHTDSVPF